MSILNELLTDLDLNEYVEHVNEYKYKYEYTLGTIYFMFLGRYDLSVFFREHNEMWSENKAEFFLTVFDNNEVHICDAKTKPDNEDPLGNVSIENFIYGSNTPIANKYLKLFKKENIDKGECFKDIKQFLNKRERITIDIDLLKNLKNCRNKLLNILCNYQDNKEISQKLIDRCLFIRFIEDRLNRTFLKNILSSQQKDSLKELVKLFNYYNKYMDGDIFEHNDIPDNIPYNVINELTYIFGDYYRRSDKQVTLFPYNFKYVPIILISHIYEEFLSNSERLNKGIVFTPENIAEHIVNKILNNEEILKKIVNNDVKILDPSCGSGIFHVKLIDEIFKIKEKHLERKLSLKEKSDIVSKSIFGIDINKDALRIAALSIYLKLIEDENPDDLEKLIFSNGDYELPRLKQNKNLINANSLFDEIFDDKTYFDIIVGNPPWGYKFEEKEKKIIEKEFPEVCEFQSSQCFIYKLKKWMNNSTYCILVLNLSIFTNIKSKKFRKYLLDNYNIDYIINISKIDEITWGRNSEPACLVSFTPYKKDRIKFYTPILSQFSLLTEIIHEGNPSNVEVNALKENDQLWHPYLFGNEQYLDLINHIDDCEIKILKYFDHSLQGINIYHSLDNIDKKEFYEKNLSKNKINEDYYPIKRNLKGIKAYLGRNNFEYIKYGEHLERFRDINKFKGNKIIITRTWPIRAFSDKDMMLYDTTFNIFKLKNKYSDDFSLLLEAILNSLLMDFYLGVKFLSRSKSNYPKVNLRYIKSIPIPNFEIESKRCQDIIKLVKKIKENKHSGSICSVKYKLDELIFKLYNVNYYNIQKIRHYKKIYRLKRNVVNNDELYEYNKEFYETMLPFLSDKIELNGESYISDFFGAMIKFNANIESNKYIIDSDKLSNFIALIEKYSIKDFDINKLFKEEKIKFYDENNLYIFKSNHPRDWTKYCAINDAHEEIEVFLDNLRF